MFRSVYEVKGNSFFCIASHINVRTYTAMPCVPSKPAVLAYCPPRPAPK